MIVFEFLLILVLLHYLGDYLFQTASMGLGKAMNTNMLLYHCLVYTATICIPTSIINENFRLVSHLNWLPVYVFLPHLAVDYITSKASKAMFDRKKMYGISSFWGVIGIDVTLHMIHLMVLTLYYTND